MVWAVCVPATSSNGLVGQQETCVGTQICDVLYPSVARLYSIQRSSVFSELLCKYIGLLMRVGSVYSIIRTDWC